MRLGYDPGWYVANARASRGASRDVDATANLHERKSPIAIYLVEVRWRVMRDVWMGDWTDRGARLGDAA